MVLIRLSPSSTALCLLHDAGPKVIASSNSGETGQAGRAGQPGHTGQTGA